MYAEILALNSAREGCYELCETIQSLVDVLLVTSRVWMERFLCPSYSLVSAQDELLDSLPAAH